jgi:hypothetical protein
MASAEGVPHDTHALLTECPTGAVLREAPHVYQAIATQSYIEGGAINPLECSPWAQAAFQIIGSERARLMERKQEMRKLKSNSKRAMAAHMGRNHGK